MSKSCASLSNVLNMFEFNLLGYFYLLSDVNTSFSCVVFVPFKSVSAVFPTPFHHFIPLLTNSQFFSCPLLALFCLISQFKDMYEKGQPQRTGSCRHIRQ